MNGEHNYKLTIFLRKYAKCLKLEEVKVVREIANNMVFPRDILMSLKKRNG